MTGSTQNLCRLHVEAVWGVRLPPLEQNEIVLLPASARPAWKLCAAEIADGRICIWRPDVEAAERLELLARLDKALLLPSTGVPPPGVSREVAFHLAAAPVVDLVVARKIARPLIPGEYGLIEEFEPGAAEESLRRPELRPFVGVIIDGRLLSLAHSSRRTTEACELGINTLPEARRKGYALAATVVWSAAILQEGLTPIYSALATNTASLNLAVAAGYREFARAATVE